MAQTYSGKDGPPRTRGWWPLAIGLVCLLLLAPASFGGGVWVGVHRGMGVLQDGRWADSTSRLLQADTAYVVLAPDPSTSLSTGQPCGALDPSGTLMPFTDSSSSTTINDVSTRWSFTTRAAGSYRLQCEGASFRVATQDKVDGLGKNIGVPVLVGLGGAVLFGLLGLGLVIFAIVRLVSTSGERRRWAQSQPPSGW